MKKIIIRILIFFGIIAIGFVVLNASYFTAQIKYFLGKDEVQVETPQASNELGEPNKLQIPSLGIDAPVQYVTETNEQVFQVALRDGVVHYPNTAEIGQVGNAYIFGHSSDMAFVPGNFKTVFALLPSIQKDAEILVTDKEGKQFKYKVYDQFVANSDAVHLLDQNTEGKKILTLQTSYPIGTALRRYIVKAALIE